MATALSTAVSPPSFDDRGRAVRLTEDEVREKNALANPAALEGDAILAAQTILAADAGDFVTIATNNVRHLSRFPGIDARPWQAITS